MSAFREVVEIGLSMVKRTRQFAITKRRILRSVVAPHFLLKFAFHTGVALLAFVLFCTLFAWVPKQPAEAGWLILYALPGISALTIWFLIRLWRRRGASAVLGIGAALLILYAIEAPALTRDAAQARAALPQTASTLGKLDAFDLSMFMNNCEELCVEVMARTGKGIIIDGRMFSLIKGEACRAEPLRSSYLQFLAAGFAGRCATESNATGSAQQMIVVVTHLYCQPFEYDGGACEAFPDSFAGRVVTVAEHGEGTVRILQRWLEGGVKPRNGWYALLGLESQSVGGWTDDSELISRAVGQKVRGWGYGGDDFDTVLTELEWFLEVTANSEVVRQAFRHVSEQGGKDNREKLRSQITRLIARSERAYLIAGLTLITYQSRIDASALRPQVGALTRSADPEIAQAARDALRAMDSL